jgi:Flp pilus assembly pilin Flp
MMLHQNERVGTRAIEACQWIEDRVEQVRDDRGQSTAEYALLLLGAATIALIVVTWATSTGKIAELFDSVIDSIIGNV